MDCPALESVQVTTVCADFLEKSCCKQQSHWRIFRWGSGQGQSWSYLCLRKIADSDGEEGLELGVRTRLESKEALSAPAVSRWQVTRPQLRQRPWRWREGNKYERQLRRALAWPWGWDRRDADGTSENVLMVYLDGWKMRTPIFYWCQRLLNEINQSFLIVSFGYDLIS